MDTAPPQGGTISPLLHRLRRYQALTAAEERALFHAAGRQVAFESKVDIVQQGTSPDESFLLTSGFAARYRLVASGARQITAIHVPGDFVDLNGFLLAPMDHAVVAVTDCQGVYFSHTALQDISDTHPHLTRLLWLTTLVDGAVHREWLVAMGRLSAVQHTAHLVCEMYLRLQTVGLCDGNSFVLPLTQGELSDALGLSAVHMNRAIQALRATEALSWQGNRINITDWNKLAEFADFDASYLGLRASSWMASRRRD